MNITYILERHNTSVLSESYSSNNEKIFGLKKCRVQKNFGQKEILSKKKIGSKEFLELTCHEMTWPVLTQINLSQLDLYQVDLSQLDQSRLNTLLKTSKHLLDIYQTPYRRLINTS